MLTTDSQLDEERRLYAQESLSRLISQGTLPRAEPRCFSACQPAGAATSLPRDIREGRNWIGYPQNSKVVVVKAQHP